MPEKYDVYGNPIGLFTDENIYYDPSLTDPAVVTAPLPVKFNGSRAAARRYAEGYRWGQENVVQPRERTAPYVGAGLAATMAAPFAIEGAVAGGVAAANSPTAPLWNAAAKKMAIDLPAFEVADRLPTLWGDDRFTTQGTNLIKQTTPIGHYAPWAIDVAGPFIAGMVPGVAGDIAMRGTVAGVNGALAYGEGVHKRAAEAALRMGDAARDAGDTGRQIISLIKSSESPSSKVEKIKLAIKQSDQMGHISKQFFNKNTLNYIFNPNADPSLAYKMPFRYSGAVAGSENASLVDIDSAHYGDVIDQFLRKAPLKNSREVPFEELPEDLQKYFSTHYPGLRTVTFSDLGQTANPFYWRMPNGKMEYSYFDSSAGLLGPDGKFMLDPGHFKMFEQRMPDGTIVGRGRDVYKYHAGDFKKTNGVGVKGDIWDKLKRRGLKFIDSAGKPIVYEWQYAPVGSSSRNKTAINLDKTTSDIVKTPATKYSLKDWLGSQSSFKELFAADNKKASLGNFLEASKKDLSEIEGLKKDITDAANDLGEYIDKFKGTSINNAVDNLEISAIMQGADDSVFKKIDAIKASMNKLKEAKAKTWSDWKDEFDIIIEDGYGSYDPTSKSESQKIVFPDDEIVFANGGLLSRLREHYKDDDKIREAIKMARQNYFARGGFGRDDVSKDGSKYYDIVRQRRNSVFNALMRAGFSTEDALRLTPMIVTQQTMEGGWVLNRKDNNFGGMKSNDVTIAYDSEDDFQDAYLKMLDSKWHEGRDREYSWRSASNLDDWARILNREDLGLHTEADWKRYNKGRQGNDFVYLYAPEWTNNNKSYRDHLRKTEARTAAYLRMIEDDEPLRSLSIRPEEQFVQPALPAVPQKEDVPPGIFQTGFRAMIPTSVPGQTQTRNATPTSQPQATLLRTLVPASVQKKMNTRPGGNLFWPGGNVERRNYNGVPTTLESYKQRQRDSIVESAVEKALKRDIGVYPEDEAGNLLPGCIYTVTDNFGKKYRVSGNQTFFANPEKYGFVVNGPVENARVGDLYQMFDRDTPSHMTLITGYDNSGEPLVSYERGYIDGYPVSEKEFNSKPIGYFAPKDKAPDYDSYRKLILQKQRDSYRKNEPLWEGENFTGYETYRFVGTPDDNARWEQEYAALPTYDLVPQVHNVLDNLRDDYRLSYTEFSTGGKIHIKPENRGKFTALKKRTGHSASWFKAHGTPAQKKMATFALNARKWKHGDGGLIERYGIDKVRAAMQKVKR